MLRKGDFCEFISSKKRRFGHSGNLIQIYFFHILGISNREGCKRGYTIRYCIINFMLSARIEYKLVTFAENTVLNTIRSRSYCGHCKFLKCFDWSNRRITNRNFFQIGRKIYFFNPSIRVKHDFVIFSTLEGTV